MLHYELCTGKCTFPGLGSPFNLEKEQERERKGERERKRKRGREGDKEKGSIGVIRCTCCHSCAASDWGLLLAGIPRLEGRERERERENMHTTYHSLILERAALTLVWPITLE